METLLPPSEGKDSAPGTAVAAHDDPPPTGGGRRFVGGADSGGVWFGVVLGVVALVFASVALVVGGGGDSSSGGGGETTTIELSEFALTPGSLTVAAGGTLEVVNTGTAAHNLAIEEAGIATADLAGGASETLDLTGLAPGEYEIICTIPGHADSGMTGTLTVTEGGAGGSAAAAESEGGEGAEAAAGHEGHSGATMTEEQYAEMSEAMNATVGEFPAETEGVGNQVLEPEIKADGTKVFELTAAITPWEVEPGKIVDAWTYNGMVPGPRLNADVGDKVEIVLNNELPMATDIHVHGVNLPNSMDGVAPITQDLVQPGESFTYSFTVDEVAVAMYHAHHHGQSQMPNGLLGTLFVGDVPLPAGQTVGGDAVPADVRVAQEIPMVLNDSGVIGYSLNGKSFPATAPITAETGDWVLLHYFNEGSQIHPMHLHQFDQIVVAKDGFPLDAPYLADTVNVAPGERYSVLVNLDEPGTWVWHCHILNHVESEAGMFGMITAVVVE